MPDLAIIADDLTGALDATAPFAMRGLATRVALGLDALPEALDSGAAIVGVSTDSREIAPEAAAAAVRAALSALPPDTPIFKKVDSRLKGNVAAELTAIPHRQSLVIPAIPEFGRVARNGHVLGFGMAEPIDIAARLGPHAGKASIPDIASQPDIDAALSGAHDLLVGARGLAEALARRMAPHAQPPDMALPDAQAFCIIGSTDPITLAQLAHLRHACPDLRDIEAPNGASTTVAEPATLTLLQATKGESPADAGAVARALGEALLKLAPPADALLVVSGGATAQVILQVLGISVLELVGEVQPGLPIARAGRLTVVTKSGGFGGPDSLSRLLAPYAGVRSPVGPNVG